MKERPWEERLAALVDVGMMLSSTLDLDSLLQRIADFSKEVIDCEYAALGVLAKSGMLERFVHSGVEVEVARRIGHLPEGKGVLGVIIERGKPLSLRTVSEHPRSVGFPEHHPEMHSFLGVPIVVRGQIFGRLYLTNKNGAEDFSKGDERVALMFASQAGAAIANAGLQEELLGRTQEVAILKERDRIAHELHDGVIQSIYSVGLALQGSASILNHDLELARMRIDAAIAELDNVIRDVRSYIFELQPNSLEGKGLRDAVLELARDFEVNTVAMATVDLEERAFDSIPVDMQVHVLQIVREILSNVSRHAQASEIYIRCTNERDEIVLAIDDDGVGFDPSSVRRGHGVTNIKERASILGGSLAIIARHPKGTRHLLRIPASNQELA